MGNNRIPFEADDFYHVYNHGNAEDNIFREDENYGYFLQKYADHISPIADTYAYCLLPNHFHFLVKIKEEDELLAFFRLALKQDHRHLEKLANLTESLPELVSRRFGNFLNGYAKAFNKRYDRRGSLFLDNLQRKKVESEAYFCRLVHYIHYNPVHHGFVENMADWTYSSYHSFVTAKKTRIKREDVWSWFGGKTGFDDYHRWKPEPGLEF